MGGIHEVPEEGMRSILRVLGPACLAAGAILLGEALATGGARLYLLVIVPVFTGTTWAFGLAVGFLVMGFLLLPLLFVGGEPSEAPRAGPSGPAAPPLADEGGAGGMVLIGPFPFFFGTWRRNPPISYRWAVALGVLLAVVAVLLLWGLSVL